MSNNKLSKKLWFNMILFSFMGQIAWNVENMYFNTFLYNSVYMGASQSAIDSSISVVSAISKMVALSAATAVITTFIMGTLSDKLRNRKLFISAGYVLWGIVTAMFGFISRDNIAHIFGLSDETKILTFTVWTVIFMDCLMTFMGSTSNDSAFNAWITDVTTPAVRPKVEAVLAILPLIATGVVMGIGTLAQTGKLEYSVFFMGLGFFVIICGLLGFILIEEPKHREIKNENYFQQLFYGFRPGVIKNNIRLYLALICLCFLNIAFQVFFPYIFVYLQYSIFPKSEGINYFSLNSILPVAISLILTVIVVILLMKKAEKNKKYALLPSAIIYALGLVGLAFSDNIIYFIMFAIPGLACNYVFSIQILAAVRDFTPQGQAGAFQGIRMIFVVLIPMLIGPKLGELASLNSGLKYVNEYAVEQIVPSSQMFMYSALAAVLILLPLLFLLKKGFETSSEA